MIVTRGDIPIGASSRAQSTLIGFVLLIGMVAAGSLGIFLAAGELLTDVEQDSEHERVQQAFIELSQQMAAASSNEDVPQSMDIDVGESGAVVMSDIGTLQIQGGDVNQTISIGAIEYNGDDGTRVAYQAGGVFRETGNRTRVVSAPPIQYDAESETLSFPIIETRGEGNLNSGDVTVKHHETDPLQDASLVENDTVTIKITSEYYRGWEEYFKKQGGATTVQDVEVIDDDRGRVTAEFGYIEGEAVFDSGITVSQPPGEGGNVHIDESDFKVNHHSMQELDEVIENMVDDKNNTDHWETPSSPWSITGSEVLTHTGSPNGTYFADSIRLDDVSENEDDVEVDVSDGDVTIVVDGDIYLNDGNANFSVTGTEGNDNQLRIYVTGNMYIGKGEMGPEPIDEELAAERLQIYGSSEMSLGMTNGIFEGFVYAPSNDFSGPNKVNQEENINNNCGPHQACFHSNPIYNGGLYVSSVYFHGGLGSIDFEYDENLKDADIDIYPDGYKLPPQITYLNIAEHQVDIEGN